MSEGRTPEATLAQQRQLSDNDVSILHEIVLRAQHEGPEGHPRDALLNAYDQVFNRRNVSRRHDQACFNIILQLLDPNVPGDSLYDKFERILLDLGLELSFEADETTTQQSNASTESEHGASIQVQAERTPPQIAHFMRQAEQYDREVLARQTFEALRGFMNARQATRRAMQQAQREAVLNSQADGLYEDRLKRKVLKQMVAVREDRQNTNACADRHYEGKLLRRVAGKTMDAFRVRRVQDMEEERLKGRSLYMWTLATREAQFRAVQRQKLIARYLAKVVECERANVTKAGHLEHIFQQRDQQQKGALLSAALDMMAQKSADLQSMTLQAARQYYDSLVRSAIYAWHSKISTINEMNTAADNASIQKYLHKLHLAALFKRDRETWLITWTLTRWRRFLIRKRQQRLEESYRQTRRMIKMNLARRMLHTWHLRTTAIHAATTCAIHHHDTTILHRIIHPAIEHLYDHSLIHARLTTTATQTATHTLQRRALRALTSRAHHLDQMTQSAERLSDNKTQRVAHKALRTLQFKAFEAQQRRVSADAFRTRQDRTLLRQSIGKLRVALLQHRGSSSNNYNYNNGGDSGKITGEHASSERGFAPITPARRRGELLLDSSARLSTTPAYTPFAARLRAEPRVWDVPEEDEEAEEEEETIDHDERDNNNDEESYTGTRAMAGESEV